MESWVRNFEVYLTIHRILAGKTTTVLGGVSLLPFVIMCLWALPQLNMRWVDFPIPQPVNWAKMLSVLLWNTSG